MDNLSFVNCERNELKEGELICDMCNGTGNFPVSDNGENCAICSKCWGKGSVDWIENVMGRKMSFSSSSSHFSIPSMSDDALKEWSEQIAYQIDKEILESCISTAEQNNKIMQIAASVLFEMGGKTV